MKRQLDLWMQAPDISSLEIAKLRRRISTIEKSLPPETSTSKAPRSGSG